MFKFIKIRLAFVFLLSMILTSSMFNTSKTNIVQAVGNKDATVYIYCKQYNGLNVGSAGHVTTNYYNFAKCLQNAKGVDGVTVVMEKTSVDVVALVKKLQLKHTFSQQSQDFSCIYGYTDMIRNYVVVDGQKINVQIAVTPTQVHVGSPLLLGSY
jgi:hypothetical protein